MEDFLGSCGNGSNRLLGRKLLFADSYGEEGFEYAPDGEDQTTQHQGKPLSDVLNMQVYSPPSHFGQEQTTGERAGPLPLAGKSVRVLLHSDSQSLIGCKPI